MKFKTNKYLKLSIIFYRMIIFALIGFITSFPLYSKINKTIIKAENIDINGNSFIPNDTLINRIKNHFNEKSINNINIAQIKKELLNIEYLNDCKVSLILPSELTIEVVEESPLALIEILNNYHYINSNGKLLSYNQKYEDIFDVPKVVPYLSQLNGIINSIQIKSEILYYLEILKNNNFLQNLDTIIIGNNEIELIDISGTKFYINNIKFDYSIKLLNIFKNQISKVKKLSDYEYINLKLGNQIIVKEKI